MTISDNKSGLHSVPRAKMFSPWAKCFSVAYKHQQSCSKCCFFECGCLCCRVVEMNLQLDQGVGCLSCLPCLIIITLTQHSSFVSLSPSTVSPLSIFLHFILCLHLCLSIHLALVSFSLPAMPLGCCLHLLAWLFLVCFFMEI